MDILIGYSTSIWFLVKVAVLFGILIYIVFALVVVRQVNLMTETLELGHEKIIKILSFLHFFFAIGVFLLALVML